MKYLLLDKKYKRNKSFNFLGADIRYARYLDIHMPVFFQCYSAEFNEFKARVGRTTSEVVGCVTMSLI